MSACWRYGVLFCNSFLIFGVYYFMEIPVGLQNEIMNSYHSYIGTNNTRIRTDCKVCLGLGEVRYNVLFAVTRWTDAIACLPLGFLIDKLGNGRSAILFSIIPLIGSVLFAVGAMSHAPVTTPMYILMVVGYGLLAFGGGLRFVQTRVIAHCFPEDTFTGIALATFGYSGQVISLFVTPYIVMGVGPIPAVWLAAVACGFGVLCAVGLACLLQLQTPQSTEDGNNKILSLRELRALPESYWWYILCIGFTPVCWIVKQANLPDYLQLRHGYTMTEATRVTGLSPLMVALSPLLCFLLKKIDCDGIMSTSVILWMVPFYALLGFCPAVNVYIIALADGIGEVTIGIMMWQLLVILCPASYVGTLAGLMFLVRNTITALTFVASGYILRRQKATDMNDALRGYQHLFIMFIIMSSTGFICGVVMNALDFRKACALNSRIGRWRQSNMQAIGLMSTIQLSSQYSGIDDVNDDTVRDYSSMKSTTCGDD